MTSIQLIITGQLPYYEHVLNFFSKNGHSIASFNESTEAKNLLNSRPVDLVVTDILMSDFDGIEFIQELRHEFPSLKILAFLNEGYTGIAHPDFLVDCSLFSGANKTLKAPCTLEMILQNIEELLHS